MSLFQKWLEIVIALRDNCFDLNGGGWGGRRKKWESFVLGVKWLPVEPRQQQQITTASNRVPLTTTLSGLLTQINIFSMRIFIFIAQTFLSEIELQVEAITRSKQWFFFFLTKWGIVEVSILNWWAPILCKPGIQLGIRQESLQLQRSVRRATWDHVKELELPVLKNLSLIGILLVFLVIAIKYVFFSAAE